MSKRVIFVNELLDKITRHAHAQYDSDGDYIGQVVRLNKIKEILEEKSDE